MKTIELTQGKVALVDSADYDWLNQWQWHKASDSCRHTFYAARTIRLHLNKRTTVQMHRLILGLQPNDGQECDHRDGDGWNNQRSNLRICTTTQNQQSSRKRKIYTSRYKGVYWRSDAHKWHSQIRVNKKLRHLGYFDSEFAAAIAYNKAAMKHFGEFALLNTLAY